MSQRAAGLLALLLALSLPLACGGGSDGGDSPTGPADGQPSVSRVEVTPGADTATALGDTQRYEAVALTSGGDTVTDVSFSWGSSDEAVATVDDGGVAEAVAEGEAEIRATAEGVTGSAAMAVIQQVASVSITPSSATLATVGDTAHFSASATDENGNAVSGAAFVWQSQNHAVATVDSAGVVTSRGNGETSVTVTAQDVPAHATLTVNQAVDHLAFRTGPTDAEAGASMSPAVQVAVLDSAGNVVENAESAVTLSIGTNPGGGTLLGTPTVNAVNGVATFSNVSVDSAATGYTLEASVSGVSSTATSQGFDVSAGPARALAFATEPSDTTAGASFRPAVEVEVRDEFGNPVTSSSAEVRLSLGSNPGNATLEGTTAVSASGGVATFSDLNVQVADSAYTLAASASGLGSGVSGAFAISPGAVSQLAFPTGPSDVEGQEPMTPAVQVELQDSYGNRVTGSSATVDLSLRDDPTGGEASLSGTTSVAATDGVATFSDLSIARPGEEFSIDASVASVPVLRNSDPFDVNLTFDHVDPGNQFTCGLTTADHAYCWGGNFSGELGDGTTAEDSIPQPVSGGHAFTQVEAGFDHACGLTTDGEAYCWGNNSYGQLGDGSTTDSSTPVAVDVSGLTVQNFSQISVGRGHACAIDTNDRLVCWGDNTQGEIGDGTTTERHTPVAVDVSGLPTQTFAQVSAGLSYTCAVTTTNTPYCWGSNNSGQLGDGSGADQTTPVAVDVSGLSTQTFSMVTTAGSTACGLDTTGYPVCWGRNFFGQIGDGTTTDRPTPVEVAIYEPLADLSAGPNASHVCGVTSDGEPICWGENIDGQLGDGTTTNDSLPTRVSTTDSYTMIAGDGGKTCGLTAGGDLYCWGENSFGELGIGSTASHSIPALVVQ